MDNEMKLANQLCFSIYNANRLFNKFYQQTLAPFGLTYPQYLVLLVLWERGGQTLHELGDRLDLSSNTLTPLLKRLENSGWIVRTQEKNDKRQLLIQLSDKGHRDRADVYEAITRCVGHDHLDILRYQNALKTNNELVRALEGVVKPGKTDC